jgi:hypothetical protein
VLTSGDQMRLPPPPDEAATRAEIEQLKVIAKQRDPATLDRIIWWNAGPPGYRWTSIAIPPGQSNATLHSRIMALLSVAIYDATVAAWDSKYAYKRLHPTAFDPSLTAALPNPQSPSYPSEHAVIAGAASSVLAYLFPDKADDFKARAEEAAQVWVQAGLHYPSDVKAGLELGRAVGALIVEWGKNGSDRTGTVDIPQGRADGRELIQRALRRNPQDLGALFGKPVAPGPPSRLPLSSGTSRTG